MKAELNAWLVKSFLPAVFIVLAGCGPDDAPQVPPATAALPPAKAVWIEGGEFLMGSDAGPANEAPAHRVSVSGFWIHSHPVSNEDFAEFVAATSYVTLAEKEISISVHPSAPPVVLEPASSVFTYNATPSDASAKSNAPASGPLNWWELVPGADWRHPQGPDSSHAALGDHPVTHVAFEDAQAYCDWRGMDLPTEAEFEYAARGGLEGRIYSWGDAPLHKSDAQGHSGPLLNHWQGSFPENNTVEDGYVLTSPVGSFPPNGYGLYDMSGNVWEWVSDWYASSHRAVADENQVAHNPAGVRRSDSFDPAEPGVAKRLIKGGSYLCSDDYCMGYRPSARMAADPDSPASHTGFRCVRRDRS